MTGLLKRRVIGAALMALLVGAVQAFLLGVGATPADAQETPEISVDVVLGECDPETGRQEVRFFFTGVDELRIVDGDNFQWGFVITSGGTIRNVPTLPPGEYAWIGVMVVEGRKVDVTDDNPFSVPGCEEPTPVSVSVGGTCRLGEEGSEAVITVSINPPGGAVVDVNGPGGFSATVPPASSPLVGPVGTYSWSATPSDGFELEGIGQDELTVEPCEPPTTTTSSTTTTSTTTTSTTTTSTTQPPVTQPPGTTPAPLGAIGDYIWFDADRDGEQDAGETPVAGVTVELFSSEGVLLATQITGADGRYLFDDLADGNYRVRFTLEGATYTSIGSSGDDVDSDAFTLSSGVGQTEIILLRNARTDLTWDAGIVINVGGIQVSTTAPPVVVTLPFTGQESQGLAVIGLAVLAIGGLLVAGARRRPQPEGTVIDGWRSN